MSALEAMVQGFKPAGANEQLSILWESEPGLRRFKTRVGLVESADFAKLGLILFRR